MKMNERMKKVLSILLCVLMLTQYVPTYAFATTTAEDGLCAHHTTHDGCNYATTGTCEYACRICAVQELINALPDEVTAENGVAVREQLAAIDTAAAELSEEEQAGVDFTKYNAVYEPATKKYTITLDYNSDGGTVEVDKETAAVGETVTFTAYVNDGYYQTTSCRSSRVKPRFLSTKETSSPCLPAM